jgi:hypothetical protein
MAVKIKRKRGAPRGNQNALKHGYYSRALNPAEQFDFQLASGIEGIGEEIALLRFQMKKAITVGDVTNLIPLSKAAFALEKLIRTNHRIFLEKQNKIKDAFKSVIRDILLPLGSGSLNSAVAANFSGQSQPVANQKNK